MAGPIDVAYVEILPDLKRFDKDATKGIKAALDDAAKEADKATAHIGESLADSVRKGSQQAKVYINKLGHEIREVDGTIHIKAVIDGKETVHTLKRDLQGRFRKENGQFAAAGLLAGLGIGTGIADGVKSAAVSGLADVGKLIGAAVSTGGPIVQGVAAFMAAQFAGITAALSGAIGPAIVALGASLPAAAGVAGAAIGTLALGFHGLSDAIENMDDVEKFDEALKKLTPSARNFALELRALQPIFSSLKAAAQEGIFKGLEGQLTRVVTTLAGPLQAGFYQVGQSIQGVIKQIADFGASATGIDLVNTLFGTTANVINNISAGLAPLADGFAKLTISATPFIEKLSLRFGEFLANIGTKLSAAADSGSLERLFENAYTTLSKVWDISKDVFIALKNVFTLSEPAGQKMLDSLKDIAQDLKKLSENKAFIEVLKATFVALTISVGSTAAAIKLFASSFEILDKAVTDIKNITSSIGKFFEESFNQTKDKVTEFIDGVVTWFSELPGEIEKFVSAIPQFVENAFRNAMAVALNALGVGIGFILSSILELPTQIGNALSGLGTTVTTFFTNLWTTVSTWTMTKWSELLTWFSELPAKVVEALSALPGQLGTFFSQLWSDVQQWAVDGWNSVIDWIAGVPGRIADLATDFYNSGLNMIKGLFNGIANGASDGAGSVGDAVYGAFKSAVNWAIGQINEGISSVDGVFPGAIPRIPYLASGGIAMGPAMVGEAGPEAAIPLTGQQGRKALRLLANAARGGSGGFGGTEGIVFEPGSIAVNFEGALPTKDQASQVGEAVAMRIATILLKRDIRTIIRVI